MVHGATLEVQTSDEKVLTGGVVVALAFRHEQKDRVHNEYGILPAFGFGACQRTSDYARPIR